MPQAPKSVSGQTFVDKVKDLKMEIFSMKRKGPYKTEAEFQREKR